MSEGLRVLEQGHPELDPNVMLLGFWLATGGNDGFSLDNDRQLSASRPISSGESSGGGGVGEEGGGLKGQEQQRHARVMTHEEMRKVTVNPPPQPSILNPQSSTLNHEPLTLSPKP